ncbi:hypothetical protein AVEN_66235-1 [Araneus ventricosus]|uniref:Uncharacterized protein n=1 Tax=Araneus ventricosus TaxID=182803 RepID=A0A4Y2I606_ARAVE|nr:hypothetical protein AVEN_66235-1 [Araneus ventricosus]
MNNQNSDGAQSGDRGELLELAAVELGLKQLLELGLKQLLEFGLKQLLELGLKQILNCNLLNTIKAEACVNTSHSKKMAKP